MDYRRLNEVTHKDSYPLPRINDTIDALSGVEWFSTRVDIGRSSWMKVPKTAFSTGHGLWQFKVMPFVMVQVPLND